uniref:Calmodulin-lysine N-methyltransferase n=1 Tax=Rhizophora mucronata TaxID=61149 RepID=A0A2P2PJC8_RHIMU
MEVKAASSLRWGILRQALLRRNPPGTRCDDLTDDEQSISIDTNRISRKKGHGFNLIPAHIVDGREDLSSRDACLCYTLPIHGAPKLFITQRAENNIADLKDFENSNKYNVDNTGLVCHWPSEEVLAYYCLSHADMFRSQKVIELGSGYGLAGLAIAATTQASEVVISDGNPQVVDCILVIFALDTFTGFSLDCKLVLSDG